MWVESSPVALVSQPLTFTVLYHPLATQSHGPAQTHQGPVGGPDPGVARRTPWDAQVSAGFSNLSSSQGTPGSAFKVVSLRPKLQS
jgi:hypothetical protein